MFKDVMQLALNDHCTPVGMLTTAHLGLQYTSALLDSHVPW